MSHARLGSEPERSINAALPHGAVAAAIRPVRKSGAWPGTKAAFEFLALTACRSGEVRLSDWPEVDLESKI